MHSLSRPRPVVLMARSMAYHVTTVKEMPNGGLVGDWDYPEWCDWNGADGCHAKGFRAKKYCTNIQIFRDVSGTPLRRPDRARRRLLADRPRAGRPLRDPAGHGLLR